MQTTPEAVMSTIPTISKEERKGLVSNFSIRSVQLKTEAQKNRKEEVIDPKLLPREPFTEAQFLDAWRDYIQGLLAKGERLQASILNISNVSLQGTTIALEVGSHIAKDDILHSEERMLAFLHKALLNYDITLLVSVNEEVAKKIVVTPEEKYERLLTENTALQEFRNALGLVPKA
ncbi:hypothetical protein [Capnocytophaga haemolytica]|nr:hypothetical protein [Capnocytophaga haemolytica]